MNEYIGFLIPFASGLLAVGGAYTGVKVVLNGSVKRIERIENKLDAIRQEETTMSVRLAHLEGACPYCPDR